MKEVRNFKNIRRKPELWGFSYMNFIAFAGVALLSSVLLFNGITVKKVILYACILLVDFVVFRYLVGENSITNRMLNEKFPKELNDFTKKQK